MFGVYLRDDQTWPYLAEQQLKSRARQVEVVNAGNSGANVHDVLTDEIRLTNRLKLHVAVITTAYNNHPLLPIKRRYSGARVSDFYFYNLSLFYVMVKEKAATLLRQPLDYGLYHQRVNVQASDVDWLVSRTESGSDRSRPSVASGVSRWSLRRSRKSSSRPG